MRAKRDVGEESGSAKTRNFKKSKMIQTYASKSYIHTCSCVWFRLAARRFMHAKGREG